MSYDSGHYNRGGMYALMLSMVFTAVFFIYVSLIHPGVDLQEVTPEGESGLVQIAQKDEAVDVSGNKEPWVADAQMIARGKHVYKQYCLMCHGAGGHGDGPAGGGLIPKPRDLVKGDWKLGGSQVALFKVLEDGIPGTSMAAWAHLPVNDRWALVHYVQAITENKVDKPDELKAFLASKK